MRTRYRLRLPLPNPPSEPAFPQPNPPEVPAFQPATLQDQAALGELMLDAYKGTVDYEGESLEEAREEVLRLMQGAYGTFLGEHSRLAWEEGSLVSAALVTLFEGRPLLAFSMTRARCKRRGLARSLITASALSLQAAGHLGLDLWVTDANTPAVTLYRAMGFEPV
ncbi:MAG: GNAT family N-acetyltransferase [Planctomycetota bacterium]|nr:GNAT family N-acetyltransferase [Planctomycetota bacterium]